MSDSNPPWLIASHDGAGPVPNALAAALTQVLVDMQQPVPVSIGVGWSAGEPDSSSTLWVEEIGEGSGVGVPIFGTEHEMLVEQIADQLQDQFFSESAGAWGEARPACPGHPHACDVKLRDGQAWWRCPVSHAWLARVGSLPR